MNCINILNRKAHYNYDILEKLSVGIKLQGSEVKSIKSGKCNISDSYCYIHNDELFLKNANISKYNSDSFSNHDEIRDRKLLIKRSELNKWKQYILQPGITIVPLKIFVNSTGLIKVIIGLCKGKKEFDKRETIKEKEIKRDLDRITKNFN